MVLDLYAGSGVLGVEALSRGASRVVFVEREATCVAVLRENLEALGVGDRARVVCGDASQALRRLGRAGERFDLVLLDPPYAGDELPGALEALARSGLLAPGATLVVEHHRRHPVAAVSGLEARDERRYGDTVITRLVAGRRGREGGPGGA